jgi:hypothetical protein
LTEFDNELKERVRLLPRRAQVGLLVGAVLALEDCWRRWAADAGEPLVEDVFQRGVTAATVFAVAGTPPPDGLAKEVEAAASLPDRDAYEWYMAAGDCWICLSSAVSSAAGESEAEDGAWYMLEPLFEDAEDRMPLPPPGRTATEEEPKILADPVVAAGIAAVGEAMELLGSGPVTAEMIAEAGRILAPLHP